MQNILQELIINNIFAFLLVFMRFGTAMMIMPGIGDSFVPPRIRLLFALAVSFVVTPILASNMPNIPSNTLALFMLLISEFFIGVFIGLVMRIIVSALDTAGTIASVQSGLSNAMVFNPATNAQGSILGAVYSSLGVTLILVTDMHHFLISSVFESYQLFPANGSIPDIGSLSEVITNVVNVSFIIGVQIALPFLIVGTILQIGLGLLGRLMPQMQIYFVALPIQILLTLIIIVITLSSGVLYWLHSYEGIIFQSFTQ